MSENRSFSVSSDPEVVIRVACTECATATKHKVLVAVKEVGDLPDVSIRWWVDYEIIQCLGCDSVSFRKDHSDTESESIDGAGNWSLDHRVELFPPRIDGQKELPNLYLVPFTVRNIYEEMIAAQQNSLPILQGVGIRAVVESVCNEKGAKGKTLENRIDSLVTMGVLTSDGAEILHGTRLLGNQAAHEQKPLSTELLNAAIEVVNHLLLSVYLLPGIAASLPRRNDPVSGNLSQSDEAL